MKLDISAAAFDIDGTIYPERRFYFKILPFILKNFSFMQAFKKVRKEIRLWQMNNPDKKIENFFDFQAELLSKYISKEPEVLKREIQEKIYEGWKPIFKKVKPYPYVLETIRLFKEQGLKIAVLSDFPPEQKNDIWGILPYCDAVLGAENTGALKPSGIPFKALAESLNLPCTKILYVGNSKKFDVDGAKAAGMKTAFIRKRFLYLFNKKVKDADISFYTYRQLSKSVL